MITFQCVARIASLARYEEKLFQLHKLKACKLVFFSGQYVVKKSEECGGEEAKAKSKSERAKAKANLHVVRVRSDTPPRVYCVVRVSRVKEPLRVTFR